MTRRGSLALVLMLAAWTGLFAAALWQDPHAANDSALLLAKSTYADGHQYVPNLFIRRWADGAPGLGARILVWVMLLVGLGAWLRRVARDSRGRGRGREAGTSPPRTLAYVAALLLAFGFLLEGVAPGTRTAPSWRGALVAGDGTLVLLDSPTRVREDEAVLGPGLVNVLVRASSPAPSLRVTVGAQGGVLRAPGLPPLVLRPTGALVDLPLTAYHEVRGQDGRGAAFCRTTLAVAGEMVLRLGEGSVSRPGAPPAPDGEMEPEADGNR